jgi:hypothetical protein
VKIWGFERAGGELKDGGENFWWEAVDRSCTVQWSAELLEGPLHGPLKREYLGIYIVSAKVFLKERTLTCWGS